jgi:hypothetical protein
LALNPTIIQGRAGSMDTRGDLEKLVALLFCSI